MDQDLAFLRRLLIAYLRMVPGLEGLPGEGDAPSIGECLDFWAGVKAAADQAAREKAERDDISTLRRLGALATSVMKPEPEPEAPPAPARKKPGRKKKPKPPTMGAHEAAAFKRTTLERLLAFREREGLGCFARLAKICGSPISETMLRGMADGNRMDLEYWWAVAQGLDEEERENDQNLL